MFPKIAAGLALCASLVPGCKKDEASQEAEAREAGEAKKDDGAPEGEGIGEAAAKAVGSAGSSSDAAPIAGKLDRGKVLGHVFTPSPTTLLRDLKDQAAPASAGMFLDENTLRTLAAGQLGSRSNVAKNIDLSAPLGCVWVETTVTEAPLVCTMGYQGGIEVLLTDLGEEGKQEDAEGHAGHYRIGGDDFYVDALGDAVVVSTHPSLLADAKTYVETNLIGRASETKEDLEVTLYPSAAFARYEEQVAPLMKAALSQGEMDTKTGNPFADAYARWSNENNESSFSYIKESAQINVGLSIEDLGVALHFASIPVEGSELQANAQKLDSGPLDTSILGVLPASSPLLIGHKFRWNDTWPVESSEQLKKELVVAYAQSTGKDEAEVKAQLASFWSEREKLYGADIGHALVDTGTGVGGWLVTVKLEGESGRDLWKTWSEGFGVETVLGKDAKDSLTWSFTPGATEVSGSPVDRWTIALSDRAKKDIEKELGPQYGVWKERLGDFTFNVDRIEHAGHVLFSIAAAGDDSVLQAGVAALEGKDALAGNEAFERVAKRRSDSSFVMATNVEQGAKWLRDLLPPDDAADIPPSLGTGIGDVFVTGGYLSGGRTFFELAVAQDFVEQLRKMGS